MSEQNNEQIDDKKSNIYHRKWMEYLALHRFAKNVNEVAGDDSNHTPYKLAVLDLIPHTIIKTERGFEFADRPWKEFIDHDIMRKISKKYELKKILKTGHIPATLSNNSGLTRNDLGEVLIKINQDGKKTGEVLIETIERIMREANLGQNAIRKFKRFTKQKKSLILSKN